MRWGLVVASAIGVAACASIANLDSVDPPASSSGTKPKSTGASSSGASSSASSSGTASSSGAGTSTSGATSDGGSTTSSSTSGTTLLGLGASCVAGDECQSGKCGPDGHCTSSCINNGDFCGIGTSDPCCIRQTCQGIGPAAACQDCLTKFTPTPDAKYCCSGESQGNNPPICK